MWISEYKFAKQALMLLFLILPFFTYAEQKRGEWSPKSCAEIHKAIGFFTYQADNYWKKKDEKKVAFYASVASDYATIYQTVCGKTE